MCSAKPTLRGIENMIVNFRTRDGLCPYFQYEDNIFHIQDEKIHNEYLYSLYHKKKNSEKVKYFKSHEEAIKYANEEHKASFIYKDEYKSLYSSITANYIIDPTGKTTIRQKPRCVSKKFENYIDCLYYAKKYVENFIKEQEPQQIDIFSKGG